MTTTKKRKANQDSSVLKLNETEYGDGGGDANQLVMVPGKKKKTDGEKPLVLKKDTTGGKKGKNFAIAKKEAKVTKQMKRKLAQIEQRKANKSTQEELFASLSEFRLDSKKINQLGSSAHMNDKHKVGDDDEPEFPSKLKAYSGKLKATATIHQKERKQENYYPTDDEDEDSSDESEKEEEGKEEAVAVTEEPPPVVTLDDPTASTSNASLAIAISSASTEEVTNAAEVTVPVTEVTIPVETVDDAAKPDILDLEKEIKPEPVDQPPKPKREHVFVTRSAEIEEKRSKLPIYAEEVPIVEAIDDNIVTIVCGETGSGKTTQIPQFLYEAGYANEGLIGITEPRRVAAISMARRVGEELASPDIVSYQIRYEGTRSDSTKILFMTDGVLMKEMETDIMLKKYSVIIIDEAHERSMYSDVLIGMLSRIAPLRSLNGHPLKLIIMSATLRLTDFTHEVLFPTLRPKVINVEARQFPVTVHFEKRTPQDYMQAAFRKVCRIHEGLPAGTILVFVTGQHEVEQLMNKLSTRYPMRYESSKSGERLLKGSKKWKDRRLEEANSLKLEDFAENKEVEEPQQLDGEDLMEPGVGGDFWDDYEDDETRTEEEDQRGPLGPPSAEAQPIYCLPLYSLLSSDKQRRVFDPPPEGSRLCVVSTNVAETSLTIPGVRYVVDSGFEKRRLYDPITGVSRFAVTHVSQASADQRAGRAGRVGPGHAYRLYSSAVFQDFPQFSRPEIVDKPADQLVLHLKSMNIVKVVNFPFPSAPDADSLQAAEHRLTKLGALATTTKAGKTESRITPLGRTLSVFPLAPAYAKVIALANQHKMMPYAILLVSALSVREPLVQVSSLRGETDEETKAKMTEVLRLRRSWCGKGPARRLGDLMVLMKAVCVSEEKRLDYRHCEQIGVRPKAMLEVRKLRTQLTNIINTSFKSSDEVTMDTALPAPSDAQAMLLRQMLVAGLADRIARRVDRSATEEDVPKGAYQSMKIKDYVYIDPCSVVYTEEPDFVLFQELVQIGDKMCMQTVMCVDHEWLPRLAETYCNYAEQDRNVEPIYNAAKDAVVRSVGVTFGPMEWPLSAIERPVPNDIMLYRHFAKFLLEGKVMARLSEYVTKLIAPPTTMIRSWAKLQQRTEQLLNALIDKEVFTRKALVEEFVANENYLLEEYLQWVPESLHSSVTLMWPPLEEHERPRKIGRNKKY